MRRFNRRSLLEVSLLGAGAALAPARAAETGWSPYANNGPVKWIIDDSSAVADTDSGKVVGYIRGDVRVFKGIPYAEVVSPEGRWARATKVRPWTGKRSARSQGPVCPQANPVGGPVAGPGADEVLLRDGDYTPWRTGEDCLRLNVWTPALDGKKRPVLFYCHGGGFSAGSALMASRFEAHNLSHYGDVVVVSINHRLNALGFLDLTAYGPRYAQSANLGMLDIVDALKWVRTNIANFGGDPSQVTIFGHSGGGGKVLTLLSMPEAKGLFHRAIAQSPGPLPFATPEQSARETAAYLKLIDVSPSNIETLHKLPIEALTRPLGGMLAAFNAARERADMALSAGGWHPTIDGKNVLYAPTLPTGAEVPLLIGTALHETYSALDHPEYAQMKEPEARQITRTFFGPAGDGIYDVYKGAFPNSIPFELSAMARATGRFRGHVVKVAQRRAALHAAPTYNYWVQWRSGTFEGRALSHHEIEMPLVFLTSDEVPNVTGGTAAARALSLKMADAWLGFARGGDPNTKDLPRWNPVTPASFTSLVFDNSCRIDHGSDLAAIEIFWKSRFPNG